ncbi:hypothetical protein [Caudoviricetes sp.]|nr:hypothetical protein [Caudoviricetes sp.]
MQELILKRLVVLLREHGVGEFEAKSLAQAILVLLRQTQV